MRTTQADIAEDSSGNMTSKTDGTTTFTYTWDENNRLTQVQRTGTSPFTASYSYDTLGRMLTRTDAGGTTKFIWDSVSCIRETAPDGIVTTYHCPQGELQSFERSGVTYQVHRDPLYSIRKVTDSSGVSVSTVDIDSWGNSLPSSSDSVPGGMPYLFTGALGVRYDSLTGLHYMRQRWYDGSLGRFLSMDLLLSPNRYTYADASPTTAIDPLGLQAQPRNYLKELTDWVSRDIQPFVDIESALEFYHSKAAEAAAAGDDAATLGWEALAAAIIFSGAQTTQESGRILGSPDSNGWEKAGAGIRFALVVLSYVMPVRAGQCAGPKSPTFGAATLRPVIYPKGLGSVPQPGRFNRSMTGLRVGWSRNPKGEYVFSIRWGKSKWHLDLFSEFWFRSARRPFTKPTQDPPIKSAPEIQWYPKERFPKP